MAYAKIKLTDSKLFPAGAMDFEKVYRDITSLEECLSYRINLKINS